MFRVFLDAGDDLSDINMTLDIGTVPGGRDVIAGKELGGFSTMLNEVTDIQTEKGYLYRISIFYAEIILNFFFQRKHTLSL